MQPPIAGASRTSVLLIAAAIAAITLPARLALINQSLWLDEVWVANSVAYSSWPDMFAGATWYQSSPPLFLVAARLVVAVAGSGEWALRLLPWAASLAAIPLLYPVLAGLYGRSASLLGLTLLASDYWSIKAAQQFKQYGTDLLVASLFAYVLWRLLSRASGGVLPLVLLSCLAPLASGPAVFWLPVALLTLIIHVRRGAAGWITAVGRLTWPVAVILAGFALSYVLVDLQGARARLAADWQPSMLGNQSLSAALSGFGNNLAHLLLPPASRLARFASWGILAIAASGAAQAVVTLARRSAAQERALIQCITGILPILTAVAASILKLYPITNYPRLILWMLPSLVILAAGGSELLLRPLERTSGAWLPQWGIPALCLLAAAAVQVVLLRAPRPNEDNRPAVASMIRQVQSGDVIYVHGGVSEAFRFYTRRFAWTPPAVYLGNSNWPCCPKDRERQVTNPGVRTFETEIPLAASQARGHRLWVYLPSAADGHWSVGLRKKIAALPQSLERQGCPLSRHEPYDQTVVFAFDCAP